MKTNTQRPLLRFGRWLSRRLREFVYVLTSFPILVAFFAIVVSGLSTGAAFIPLTVLVLLALLTAMEFVARFEIRRTNWLLRTQYEMSNAPWFKEKFFSWEGAKERVASMRSWLAIGYVFLAFGLAILGFIFASLAIALVFALLVVVGLIGLHPWNGSFRITESDFNGNILVNFDKNDLKINFLGFHVQDTPSNGHITWAYNSPINTVLSVILIVLSVIMISLIAKSQRKLIVKFLSNRSYAEVYYNSDSRRKKAVSVGTQDRNRIEKDLHDGVQARLTVSGIEIDKARILAEKSQDVELTSALDRAAQETSNAMQEIRDLVRGLRPALLEKDGLKAALLSLGERQSFQISIEVNSQRLNPEIESAIYLICSEAITNVNRHAKASNMSISINQKGKLISLDIEDDGVGGADSEVGIGLKNMQDRTDSLGGELIIYSPVGGPTMIKAIIPCE